MTMSEPKPDVQKETQREKLGGDFYKFYFLFQQVLDHVGRIMAGKDAPEYRDLSEEQKEIDSIFRHGIGNWIMAPTMPVMSGRMEMFTDPEKNIELDHAAEDLLRDVSNQKFTWRQRIEKAQEFILACLAILYPGISLERIRERFGGDEQERQWLLAYRKEKRESENPIDQFPRT